MSSIIVKLAALSNLVGVGDESLDFVVFLLFVFDLIFIVYRSFDIEEGVGATLLSSLATMALKII